MARAWATSAPIFGLLARATCCSLFGAAEAPTEDGVDGFGICVELELAE